MLSSQIACRIRKVMVLRRRVDVVLIAVFLTPPSICMLHFVITPQTEIGEASATFLKHVFHCSVVAYH